MAGGLNTPDLASSVSNSGGVGSFGFSYSKPEAIDKDLEKTKSLTKGPINCNFFVFQPVSLPSKAIQSEAIQALKALPILEGVEINFPAEPFYPDIDDQIEVIWEHRPEILTFHFGLPKKEIFEKALSMGISVGVTATNLSDAMAIKEAGADFIVAQGIEAGGHRGNFAENDFDEELPLLVLLQKLSTEIELPLVAAGGVMNGSDVGSCIEKGAIAAQLGTAFLCCDEAGTGKTYRRFLMNESGRGTKFTKAFSGRRARGIDNLFIKLMEQKEILPFPIQNTLTSSLRKIATDIDEGEYQSLWAGSAFEKIRALPAAELMKALSFELNLYNDSPKVQNSYKQRH